MAANYGGRWDMLQAVTRMLKERPELAKERERLHRCFREAEATLPGQLTQFQYRASEP